MSLHFVIHPPMDHTTAYSLHPNQLDHPPLVSGGVTQLMTYIPLHIHLRSVFGIFTYVGPNHSVLYFFQSWPHQHSILGQGIYQFKVIIQM